MLVSSTISIAQQSIETERQYLSGHGCDDMVEWDFFCTNGRNSGKWTKIGVPSCWELQGFGTYQYGMRFYGNRTPEGIADEKGLYKCEFTLPQSWEGRQIQLVFEAAMTDAKVTINGRKGGNHQGGFYRFALDVSDRVFFGKKKNRLEVEVSKESENSQVNMAERRADYWNFGGIIRPVFVVSKPIENIDRVAIDAGMDGKFTATCYLNRAIKGSVVNVSILNAQGQRIASADFPTRDSDVATAEIHVKNPLLWTAETPNLYTSVFTLKDQYGKTLHVHRERFGFRTIEIREHDGVYINGHKVIFKGVNRHSFRPETGRTLSKEKNIEDVLLIKSMNMNAVRLSHYPADPEFLEACDSLGLYVENELSGWHWAHETIVGQQLVKEMVTRDVNHPSVIFWSNGNEGGFNYELEQEFYRWDPQHRVVLYPWANRNGFETKHYRSYGETQEYMRQPEIFMPTEFLHGLYDGGHGAGLKDYWDMMMANPRCAGGFLWDFSDQAVVRTDLGGILDCQGNNGADGILGPHFEKEGSFYTIKEVWSPVEIIKTEDGYQISNHYDFLNLSTCKVTYKYIRMPEPGGTKVSIDKEGVLPSPNCEPGKSVALKIPQSPYTGSIEDGRLPILAITIEDLYGREILQWTTPLAKTSHSKSSPQNEAYTIEEDNDKVVVSGQGRTYTFSKENGMLLNVRVSDKSITFGNGPKFIAIRRSDRSFDGFYNHDDKDAFNKKTQYSVYNDYGKFNHFDKDINSSGHLKSLTAVYEHGSLQSATWTFNVDGTIGLSYIYDFGGVVDAIGVTFDYPEQKVRSKRWVGHGPYRVWQNRLQGPTYGYWTTDYNDPIPAESFEYPEFKGYFAHVEWMELNTDEGKILIENTFPDDQYIGVYAPRDGRDHILYELPETGISILQAIPAVRNKVNTTDLNGPSAQPFWAIGKHEGRVIFNFSEARGN